MRRHAILVVLAMAACGPAPEAQTPGAPKADGASAVAKLDEVEGEVLQDLAALDRRFALRAHVEPTEQDLHRVTMGAMLAEDPTLAVVDGAIDPFSFEARARGLAAVQQKMQSAPRDLPPGAAALERELLDRLVDAELARLDADRGLPRSASALVRGLVSTWRAPRTPQEAGDRDRWLARRLEEVLKSIEGAGLDVGRARELDDSLDALEHLMDASALAKATAMLVRLREALEQQGNRPRGPAASEWAVVGPAVKAQLGLALGPDALDEKLAVIEQDLEKQANAAIEAAHVPSDEIEAKAAPQLFAPASQEPCAVKVDGSRLRSLEPPPERTAACAVRRIANGATDDASRAVALVVAHDHVTVARWALHVASGRLTIAETTAQHRPRSRPGPDFTARWERIALSQPTRAIGGGYAAIIVYSASDVAARAKAWSALGDVPLDIADRELR